MHRDQEGLLFVDGTRGNSGPRRQGKRPATRLQKFLNANGLTSVQLETATGISRPAMSRIRAGGDVRRQTMLRILLGARKLAGRRVRMDEIFDLEPMTQKEEP